MKNNSRRTAAFILARYFVTHDFPSNMLPEGPDRPFVQDLVYTTLRYLRALRKILGVLVRQWPKGELEALLYVGAAQIFYMDSVPDFAAVNETVEAAKLCGNPAIVRTVNGVLRNLLRRRDELWGMIKTAPFEERESFPTHLARRFVARYGEEDAARLCQWFNEPAVTFLARKDGSFVELERGVKVREVSGYAEGEFIVQDPATALAVRLLDVKQGMRTLDACASPGGKTAQLCWRGAEVTACEVNPRRRKRLVENLERLRLAATIAASFDEVQLKGGSFERVLVDAPCSNTGVLRRRPDARWNWSEEKLSSLIKLQREILFVAAPLVAEGGVLVYSTCSLEPEENSAQVEAFLAAHAEFEFVAAEESNPLITGHDGAFAAAMRKKSAKEVG